MTCGICGSFKRPDDVGIKKPSQVRVKDAPILQLERSSITCECCKIMYDGIGGVLAQQKIDWQEVARFDLQINYPPEEIDGSDYDYDDFRLITLRLRDGSTVAIEFFAADGSMYPDAWDDFCGRPIRTDNTGSDAAIKLAQQWLEKCIQDDEFCPGNKDSELPARVVKVGLEDDVIKVIETNGMRGQYVCLSHCWGLQQIITTTQSTYEARKTRIRAEELTKTFNEAIIVTRRLGIPYIWIDSLCIVQDDSADWDKESVKMAQYYGNAILTIAATKSSSGLGGLFTSTPSYELKGTIQDGDSYHLAFCRQIEHSLSYEQVELNEFPLLSRAWIFQERLLSPRVLHFGPHELFFECLSYAGCECRQIQGAEVQNMLPKQMYNDALDNAANVYYLARAWRSLISQYSALPLTYKCDRLPAFGGLAQQMSRYRNSRYMAGIWEDSLIDDLVWAAQPIRPKIDEWRAPSWSWAAVEGVYYDDAPMIWYEDESMIKRQADKYTQYTKIEKCECVAKGATQFGELRSGILTLSAICVEGSLSSKSPTAQTKAGRSYHPSSKENWWMVLIGSNEYLMDPDYKIDESHINHAKSQVLCVLLISDTDTSTRDGEKLVYSLVVQRSKRDPDVYERIGLLNVRNRWQQDVEGFIAAHNEKRQIIIV